LAGTGLQQVTLAGERRGSRVPPASFGPGVTVPTIHQRLRDEHGLAVSVVGQRRYVAADVAEEVRRSQELVRNPAPAGTAAEPAVTEIAAGSGLYQPTLFDA
jgi:hypothetical protein